MKAKIQCRRGFFVDIARQMGTLNKFRPSRKCKTTKAEERLFVFPSAFKKAGE